MDTQAETVEGAIVVHAAPRELYRVATDVAGLCGDIVKRTAKKIQNRQYVCVEGWQAIATAHGCMLSIESVTEDADGSVSATAGVRRMSDGVLLAKAEGFVGMDERMWSGRPRYARRAMAQTRAMSRAARSAFAHVVVLIDAGLQTTPAEEMFDGEETQLPARAPSQVEARTIALDEAFEARGFDTAARSAVVVGVCKKHSVKRVTDLPDDKWRAFLSSIGNGSLDKAKGEGKAA